MFELKVLDNAGKPYEGWDGLYEQIERYKWKYGINGVRYEEMCKILAKYPHFKNYSNDSIRVFNDVVFLAVIAYDDNKIDAMIDTKIDNWNIQIKSLESLNKS